LLGADETHLTSFDAWTVVASTVIATLLMMIRRLRKLEHKARQWLDDALNVGTMIVLVTLVAASFPWWVVRFSASPLTDIALIYCGGLISTAMYRSISVPRP
jgi:hypothetical protein